jgi:hypothetical protein
MLVMVLIVMRRNHPPQKCGPNSKKCMGKCSISFISFYKNKIAGKTLCNFVKSDVGYQMVFFIFFYKHV